MRTESELETLESPPTTTTGPETVQLAAPQSAPATASGCTSGMREAVPPARIDAHVGRDQCRDDEPPRTEEQLVARDSRPDAS